MPKSDSLAIVKTGEIVKSGPRSSGTNIPGGVIARASGALVGAVNGWFGPGNPLPTVAPSGTPVRVLDYPEAVNLQTTSRPYAPIPFEDLRRFSRSYPLLRFAIEKLKDRICSKDWTIQPRKLPDEKPAEYKARSGADPRVAALREAFRKPDLENSWRVWLRKLLEDYLVLDAGSISVQRTNKGGVYRFLVVDGATIVRKVDLQGMTPMGPTDVAYQQIVKGLPAVDLSKRDLLYCAENTPAHGLYGYGRVEQAVQLAVLGINRLIHQTNYYTEGSVPDTFAFLPEGTTPEESERWDALFQKIMTGNSAKKRKVWWMPWSGHAPEQMKAQDLTDKMDELLNRYICWIFGLSPSAIVPQVNRAAAGQMADDADEAGETPVSMWVVDAINDLIQSPDYLNCPDLEFVWVEQSEVDNLVQKEIDQIDFAMAAQTGNGITVFNEIRDREGKPQLEDKTPEPVPPVEEDGPPGTAANASPPTTPKKLLEASLAKAASRRKAAAEATGKTLTIDPGKETPSKAKARKALGGALTDFFAEQAQTLSKAIGLEYARQKMAEAERAKAKDGTEEDDGQGREVAEKILDNAALDWSALPDRIEKFLQQAALSGVADAGTQLGTTHDIFAQANEWALAYAEDRGAELVGMRVVDGKLVTNPDAKWAITDTTREKLVEIITDGLQNGTPVADIKTIIQESTLFSESRAKMIATTEVNFANSGGMFEVGNLVGHTAKRSILSGDHDLDDDCDDNADESDGDDGIPIGETFPSGDMYSPFHPNCVCLTQTFTPGEEL